VENLIQNIQDNLDILPAGPKPPDPAKLLNSGRAQEVINSIRAMKQYDMVLFDAPPCLMLADPILLGEKLDGILFLVGLGKVSRELAPQACRRIKATGVDVLGLICNQVYFPSRLNDYGYEYGYYYHYAYANANGYSSTYGRYGKALGRYAKGIGSYVRRYRDSYFNDRYVREGSGSAVQRYHDDAVSSEMKQARENGAANGTITVEPSKGADSLAQRNLPSGERGNASPSAERGSSNNGSSDGRSPGKGSSDDGSADGGSKGGWFNRLPFRR
jgi:succinoglycan biosynthesis transport protein ExoP